MLTSCSKKPSEGPPPVNRCEVDLEAAGLVVREGTGASAGFVESADSLIGGQVPTGAIGDVLLENDRIRVVVQKPGRLVGPIPQGGAIVDADLVRGPGEPGRDQFGRVGLLYALGRLIRVTDVEVLDDGSRGGSAIVAATGVDDVHDLLNVKDLVRSALEMNVSFVVDPDRALALRATTYYVLSPGESRVRVLTAFCNDGPQPAVLPLVELVDLGGSVDFFNPDGCANGVGNADCLMDPSSWFGGQGDGVAYAFRSYALDDLRRPVEANALFAYGGVAGSLIDGRNMNGAVSWLDTEAQDRPGSFAIRAGGQRSYLRDFVVGRDLAEISSLFLELDGAARGRLALTVQRADGSPAAGARVAVERVLDGRVVTVAVADQEGRASVQLAPGPYRVSAAAVGHALEPGAQVQVEAGGAHSAALRLGASRKLSVSVRDPFDRPMPAKVTVRCLASCADPAGYRRFFHLESLPGDAAAIGLVPVSGELELALPPALYDVVVTRGPEFSAWPDSWPRSAQRVDLTSGDGAVDAVLARVVDSAGWMSADLHVHAVASGDSSVANEQRVATFLAEGVDVLLSTDHEAVTDFWPVIRALGAEGQIASMVGSEVTTFSHGHFNAFPLVRRDTPNGGAFDHAGGDGPTLRLEELFEGIKAEHEGAVVQINHPRGMGGALTRLEVDTATLASHAPAPSFRMAPAPDATGEDTRLFSDRFDALEIANGASPSFANLNDWMTFLSRGTVRTATGVSDTHSAFTSVGGYSRTYARVGVDAPGEFAPALFAQAIRKQHAFLTNGPFLQFSARRRDSGGQLVGDPVGMGETLSVDSAAGESLELTVEVQAPEWVAFDTVEVYTHAPGREAWKGASNGAWPDTRIHQQRTLDVSALPLEAVPGTNGLSFRRLRVVESFTVLPTADTWYVAMVRTRGQGRSLSPLIEANPYAVSNAILVDGDGSGAYDEFPQSFAQPLRAAQPQPAPEPPRAPTAQELERGLLRIFDHHPRAH